MGMVLTRRHGSRRGQNFLQSYRLLVWNSWNMQVVQLDTYSIHNFDPLSGNSKKEE